MWCHRRAHFKGCCSLLPMSLMSFATTAEGAGKSGAAPWAACQVSSATPRQGSLTIEHTGLAEADSLCAACPSTSMASLVALLSLHKAAGANSWSW